MRGTGLTDLARFGDLFQDAIPLTLFTHQDWWRFVNARSNPAWGDWVRWIQERYFFDEPADRERRA
jgi:hypothetical protein